jgi:hypothetical protein
MATIRERIELNLQAWQKARIEKLTGINAPQVIIDNLIKGIESNDLAGKVRHIKDFGNLEYTAVEPKKFRRGTGAVFTTETGNIFFIPGPYSYFLTDKEKGN